MNGMIRLSITSDDGQGLHEERIRKALTKSLKGHDRKLERVLLIPPDLTRAHSGAGDITGMYYDILKDSCQVDIMPALGTHMAMTHEEIDLFFGDDIPKDSFKVHNWRTDVVKVGQVPGQYISEISGGLVDEPIDVEINKILLDESYDLIISIGQVVPHEVVGMANYSKNIFVGCGGMDIINKSHMLGAVFGMERIMGRDHSPVRKVFDYCEKHFTKGMPLMYVLTVTTTREDNVDIHGLYIGNERSLFEEAVKLSQEKNLEYVDRPLKKVVVYLDETEFKSTWLGNKSVYRTRMAIEDGGELIVLAPGVRQFGEDQENDRLIRKYGYVGRLKVLELFNENQDLKENQSVAAHLIHGSSDDRFSITYAPGHLTREEVEGINYNYMSLKEALEKYDPKKLRDGYNTLEDGEEVFYISNPALGLWADRSKF
ncbi:MAG TPA: lactate racemase domain-containing protein [Clostridia bacterium]|nr:lactate racemase domain-containing protein [Clostridia bacterium]